MLPVIFHASLQKLFVDGMNSALPIGSIVSSDLTALFYLRLSMRNVKGLACLPEGMLKDNNDLASLVIADCHNLTYFAHHGDSKYCWKSLQKLKSVLILGFYPTGYTYFS